mmetsp:Transcript_87596/g.246062  ORF Transcript_87596/g.246062 Transcript_87596/m.246062 type:complete len:298 (+) Transcript_87596:170-1063(+)
MRRSVHSQLLVERDDIQEVQYLLDTTGRHAPLLRCCAVLSLRVLTRRLVVQRLEGLVHPHMENREEKHLPNQQTGDDGLLNLILRVTGLRMLGAVLEGAEIIRNPNRDLLPRGDHHEELDRQELWYGAHRTQRLHVGMVKQDQAIHCHSGCCKHDGADRAADDFEDLLGQAICQARHTKANEGDWHVRHYATERPAHESCRWSPRVCGDEPADGDDVVAVRHVQPRAQPWQPAKVQYEHLQKGEEDDALVELLEGGDDFPERHEAENLGEERHDTVDWHHEKDADREGVRIVSTWGV